MGAHPQFRQFHTYEKSLKINKTLQASLASSGDAHWRYKSSIFSETDRQENSFCIHSRPTMPMRWRGMVLILRIASARVTGSLSTHRPHFISSSRFHGVPLLAITGTPWAKASATTMAKFSV